MTGKELRAKRNLLGVSMQYVVDEMDKIGIHTTKQAVQSIEHMDELSNSPTAYLYMDMLSKIFLRTDSIIIETNVLSSIAKRRLKDAEIDNK